MNLLQKLTLATAILGASVGVAQASENFAGLTWGETSNNIQKSHALNRNLNDPKLDSVIDNSSTWGVRAGQQNDTGRY